MPIIWITGLPNAGKTVAADLVATRLRDSGRSVMRLDGDLMRLLFGWSEAQSDDERRALSTRYVQIAEAFSAQGLFVVVSVVAIYSETFVALREAATQSTLVYLDVSDDELARRDARRIYSESSLAAFRDAIASVPPEARRVLNADRPISATVDDIIQIIERDGLIKVVPVEPFDTYAQIRWQAREPVHRRAYWDDYYTRKDTNQQLESSFAREVRSRLEGGAHRILDFGCGNGRDTFFLAEFASVVGVDTSAAAVARCSAEAHVRGVSNPSFVVIGETAIESVIASVKPDVIFSRFVLHAMTEEEQRAFLVALATGIEWEARLFIECRATEDDLERKGVYISAHENFVGHYRRFIDPEQLRAALVEYGWSIDRMEVGRGFAKHPSGDPRVLRIEASRGATPCAL